MAGASTLSEQEMRAELKVTTCSSWLSPASGTDMTISFQPDFNTSWFKLSNPGDDRVPGEKDKYLVPAAVWAGTLRAEGTDGWCISELEYNGVKMDLSCTQDWGNDCEIDPIRGKIQ